VPVSSCDWINSKAVQRLVHKETARADFNFSGDINIVGVQAWKNDKTMGENRDTFD